MKHQSLDGIRDRADVLPLAGDTLTRRQRLNRWAELLMRAPDTPLTALRWVEFYALPERRQLRGDGSPLQVAFSDPVLRAAGLTGDTLGQAQRFFGLSGQEAHFLLCDCHYRGGMNARNVARRVRTLGWPTPLRQAWMALQAP